MLRAPEKVSPFEGFSDDRFRPADLPRLLAVSPALRAFVAMLRRNPGRCASAGAQEAFLVHCDRVRLDLRIAIDLHPGVGAPRTEKEALLYMQCPRFVRSLTHLRLQSEGDRNEADPRALLVVKRLVRDAEAVGVPLWAPAVDREAVHIGHGVHRLLPWRCWDLLENWADEAAIAVGMRIVPSDVIPGQFWLADDCAQLPEAATLKPKRLTRNEADAEREALLAYYGGDDWAGHPADLADGSRQGEAERSPSGGEGGNDVPF